MVITSIIDGSSTKKIILILHIIFEQQDNKYIYQNNSGEADYEADNNEYVR